MAPHNVVAFSARRHSTAQFQQLSVPPPSPDEWERSDYDRDPRFPPGWWIILPMCLLTWFSAFVCLGAYLLD